MRLFLAIVCCKLARFVGKRIGKGSSMPGQLALKICPDILGRLELPKTIIAVTGSNGKTSTVEMIAAIVRKSGQTLVYNAEGANQTEGVTTALLSHATLGGKVNADVLLLESDERYAKRTFAFFHPTHFVVTNLYRDQLTRNAHPQWVYRDIESALHKDTTLVLNADDPLVSCLGAQASNVQWFGLNRCEFSTDAPTGMYHDGAHCPVCHGAMEYAYAHYNHIGAYHCTVCKHHRPESNFTATAVDLQQGRLTIDDAVEIELAFCSIYNVYNILAAYSVCRLCGVPAEVAKDTINHYILKNGRMVKFTLGQHGGTLLTSKHENSIAYDTNLRYIRSSEAPCEVVVIVDAISRKYFTSETSWLWDIDFNLLDCPHVEKIHLAGQYRWDLAQRMEFTTIDQQRIVCADTIATLAETLEGAGTLPLYVVTCFADRDKFLNLTKREVQS